MPNWCFSTLVVTGSPEELAAFRQKAEGPNAFGDPGVLTFHAFVPYPEEYARLDKAHIAYTRAIAVRKRILGRIPTDREVAELKKELNAPEKSGYEIGGMNWCYDHWGTRWDANQPELEEEAGALIYRFSTAWSPPIPVVRAMAAQHPRLTLELEYEEGWEGYAGRCRFAGGVLIEEAEWEPEERED
ncbi:MAG: hypothetical protein N2047_06185 [Meiothermus sp.]|jgi:hypothetical protein|uniref:DUF1281 family ferredoxin-like fold protein n=1 Tax=Meiothermus cerbereus TaxID=65552 RepID=UPI0021DE004E|nr:hypothetical protein [Meiothermus sp.]GIW31555.1 MAG: hypothetical protein KatS3mg071_1729 [Meiothermus sp.]